MIGVIAKIDIDDNSAIIVDKNKKQYPFSLEDGVGFDLYPNLGEEVEFGLNNNEIYFVTPIDKRKNIQHTEVKEKTAEEKTKKKFNQQIKSNIPLDKSIEDCLENYFEEVISVVYKYEAEFEEGEQLDFLMMKRFLNTAYNNLKDMDSTFMDEYVLELRSDLKVLERVYQKFHKKNTTPEIAYDSIFLEQQGTYRNYKKRIETNISELYALQSSVKSLEYKIQDINNEIKTLNNEKVIESKVNDLKRYNRYHVDSIHRSATIKDENRELKKALTQFEQQYHEEFILEYIQVAKKYDSYLREQLDGYAYEFDKKMWESAETSNAIRGFFKRANIEEEYSSKTFLKYFIKSLDSMKFSQEHKRLNALLEYLESRAKIRILIVSEDTVEADSVKHLVRSFDKEYSVENNDKPRSTYYRKDLAKLDIVFADLSMKNPPIMEFVDMIQKRFKQTKSKAILCVTSNAFTKESLSLLRQKGVNHLLSTNLDDVHLQQHVKEIIDSIND
jgi:CheY-like chemotaxis protein